MKDLFLTARFKRAWKKLPLLLQPSLNEHIQALRVDDATLDVKKLHGQDPAVFRLRVGDYRVLFARDAASITCLEVGLRKDIYC